MGHSLYVALAVAENADARRHALTRSSQSRGLDKTSGKFGAHEPQALLSPEETAYRAAIHDKRKTRTQSLILKFLLAIVYVCLPHPVAAAKLYAPHSLTECNFGDELTYNNNKCSVGCEIPKDVYRCPCPTCPRFDKCPVCAKKEIITFTCQTIGKHNGTDEEVGCGVTKFVKKTELKKSCVDGKIFEQIVDQAESEGGVFNIPFELLNTETLDKWPTELKKFCPCARKYCDTAGKPVVMEMTTERGSPVDVYEKCFCCFHKTCVCTFKDKGCFSNLFCCQCIKCCPTCC